MEEETVNNVQKNIAEQYEIYKEHSVIHEKLSEFFKPESIMNFVFILCAILVLIIVYLIIKKIISKIPEEKLKPKARGMILKILKYTLEILIVIYILNLFGVNLSAVFGAAGIAGVALALAAQTMLSNLLSGFFIFNEKKHHIGDIIMIDDVEGYIDSIDLFCTRIRTFDNAIVRIPNESLMKTNIKNSSAFDYVRREKTLCLDYGEDLQRAIPIITEAVKKSDLVLKEPACKVLCNDFTDKGVELDIYYYIKIDNGITAADQVIRNVIEACHQNSIKINYQVVEVKENSEVKRVKNV